MFTAASEVDLFEDAEGASGYFQNAAANVAEYAGITRGAHTIKNTENFDAALSDDAVGFNIATNFEYNDGSTIDI